VNLKFCNFVPTILSNSLFYIEGALLNSFAFMESSYDVVRIEFGFRTNLFFRLTVSLHALAAALGGTCGVTRFQQVCPWLVDQMAGQYEYAKVGLMQCAEEGNAEAQYQLAYHFTHGGLGLRPSRDAAREWSVRAGSNRPEFPVLVEAMALVRPLKTCEATCIDPLCLGPRPEDQTADLQQIDNALLALLVVAQREGVEALYALLEVVALLEVRAVHYGDLGSDGRSVVLAVACLRFGVSQCALARVLRREGDVKATSLLLKEAALQVVSFDVCLFCWFLTFC
jgi:hypothetical protein